MPVAARQLASNGGEARDTLPSQAFTSHHLDGRSQHVFVEIDVQLGCGDALVSCRTGKHPYFDALVCKRSDEGAAGAAGSGPVQPRVDVRMQHQLTQAVG